MKTFDFIIIKCILYFGKKLSFFSIFRFLLIVHCSLLIVHCLNAQPGKVTIIADPGLDQLIKVHKALNEKINGMQGYRIQIFSESGTNSKFKADSEKNDFMLKFPDASVYIIFQEPNYKVRVGDFRTQLDALGYLHKITSFFPNAYIVKDKINFPKIN